MTWGEAGPIEEGGSIANRVFLRRRWKGRKSDARKPLVGHCDFDLAFGCVPPPLSRSKFDDRLAAHRGNTARRICGKRSRPIDFGREMECLVPRGGYSE